MARLNCLTVGIGFAFAAVVISSCSEPLPAPQADGRSSRLALSQEALQFPGGHAEKWANLSRLLPGFGGMYSNSDGDLVVILKDTLGQKNAAWATLAGYVGQSHRPQSLGAVGHAPTMLFRSGAYDYQELLTYKDNLSLALRPLNSSLSSIGVDELTNTVNVGVSDAQMLSRVHDLALQAGLPSGALTVLQEQRAALLSTMYLNDTIKPVVAGLRLATNGTTCTVGLPVRWGPDSLPGFLTAGHCAGSNGDSVALWDRSNNLQNIGAVADNGNSTYGCTHGTCIHADAALMAFKSSVTF